jgi:threonylcarbamoyladenosine tRNA methylthiotransferase MtaB
MRVYLRTFGCRANHYDSEQARAMLESAGVHLVTDVHEADVAIFNGCAVTADAVADVRQATRRAARENPAVRSIIAGCAAAADASLATLPSVSHLVPGTELDVLASALGIPNVHAHAMHQTSTRAVLRVQDGCDEHCTFCITRVARGSHRSRAAADLVAEARALAEHHPEIVITGTHIGSYGSDVGSSLGALVERLVSDVPEVRFRLSSLEATEVDETLRALMRDAPGRVAPHLHAPLQSGSDRVLRRMGRHWYTAETYADAVLRLVDDRPVFGLSADVIVGFPGETEEDHAATLALVERLPFTGLHVFPYSPRPGTPAERLTGQVPAETVRRRAAELRALGAAKAAAYRAARAGQEADVVVTGTGARRIGVTEDYLTIPVDPTIPRGTRFTSIIPA